MVEWASHAECDPPHYGIDILQHRIGWNAQYPHALLSQPRISFRVPARAISTSMRLTIDFNRQPAARTKEIQHIGSRRMLVPKLETRRPLAQFVPRQDLRQRHGFTQFFRAAYRFPWSHQFHAALPPVFNVLAMF